MLLFISNYTSLLRLSYPVRATPHVWELPWSSCLLGSDFGAGWRLHISKAGPRFARLRCFVVTTLHSVPQLSAVSGLDISEAHSPPKESPD